MILCNHKFNPEIDSKGYQFCTKCGKAHYVGFKCTHNRAKLETIDVIKTTVTLDKVTTTEVIYIQQCPDCGKILQTTIK